MIRFDSLFPRSVPALVGALMAILAGCSAFGAGVSGSRSTGPSSAAADAQKALARGDYAGAARAWERASVQAVPPQSSEFRLRAAEAATDGADYALADALLQALPPAALDLPQRQRVDVLRARAALARGDVAGALRLLPPQPQASPMAQRELFWRARALFQGGTPVEAVQTLVQRERLLDDPRMVAENRNAIWNGLGAASLDPSALAQAGGADPVTRGWVELANLARRNGSLEFYENWRQRYPGHPGEERLADLMMPLHSRVAAAPSPAPATGATDAERPSVPPAAAVAPPAPASAPGPAAPGPAPAVPARPGFYALLLPQSGALAGFGDAVHAGFAAAAARAGDTTDLRVYDVGAGPAAVPAAYDRAVADGAGVVIGPLLKDGVALLAQRGSLRVPVLALNYLDYGRAAPPGLYQFGLAPEDEARAAAEDAAARGLRRALVMVQDDERGRRLRDAFEQRLRELGGSIAGSGQFTGPAQEWSQPVASLMHFHPVQDRKKLAEIRAKAQPGIDPQRRNDFDVIFIGVRDAGQARQIAALFRYFHAERTPLYANSAVNEGSGDFDLARIRFCDSPWLLDGSGAYATTRAAATEGRGLEQARFYVLGGDAFQLALRMAQNSLRPLDELPADNGTLGVGDDRSVHRGLVCAQATEGAPQLLEPPGSAVPQ
ncbi:MAG: penicillin-binding protein activator [Nevskia sp.]|nr:penicillin-binding protein activator [Nevskia sp.]